MPSNVSLKMDLELLKTASKGTEQRKKSAKRERIVNEVIESKSG
jgi:hypothetical protein